MTTSPSWAGTEAAILFNNAAGNSGARKLAETIADSLRQRHANPEVVSIQDGAQSISDRIDAIRAASPELIISVGGDGTVNAAATIAIEKNIPLLIVPAGTMDLVARDLDIPTDFEIYLKQFTHFRERLIDYATVNDLPFLHSAHVGLVPRMSEDREALREANTIAEKLNAAQRMFLTAAVADPLDLTLRSDNGKAKRSTQSLTVTCNPLLEGPLGSHRRATLDSGTLGVFVSNHEGPAATPKLLASMLAGRISDDLDIESTICSRLDVESKYLALDVGLDGEVRTLEPPLHFQAHRRGLRVLAPTP